VYNILVGEPEGRDNLDHADIDGRIILNES
jgi:hypothetical protein